MKNRKKLFLVAVLAVTLAFTACARQAHGQHNPESDFEFVIIGNNEGVRITRYVGNREMVVIPPRIQRIPVTEIGEMAFDPFYTNIRITSVIIPNRVTSIGRMAFYNNQLTSVIIPDSVTYIDRSAFERNQLTSVTIGNSVTYIGSSAFSNNRLTSVTIPNSVTYIDSSAFRNLLTSVTIGADVTIANANAFPTGFVTAYNNSGRLAGTYTRPDTTSTVWTRQ